MIYSVRHTTTFRYEPAVRESVMEVRLQPRSDGEQRCLNFTLTVDPAANVMQYRDFMGNTVHHFDIAGRHYGGESDGAVGGRSAEHVPAARGHSGDWADLDALVAGNDYWEMLLPSHFAQSSAPLEQLPRELACERRGNPLALLTELNEAIYKLFAYVPNSTEVDSPIEEALETRQGVCQDFAHIMIALVRRMQIPCRYVSGYMFHRDEDDHEPIARRRVPRLDRGAGAGTGLGRIRSRPIIWSEATGTFASPLAAITLTSRRRAESTKVRRRAS